MKGELAVTSTFQYDEHARPLAIQRSQTTEQYGEQISTLELTYDEHGNLLRVQEEYTNNWTEFTYTAMEVRKSDAERANALMHSVSRTLMVSYTEQWLMDPLGWELTHYRLYHEHNMYNAFYYMVPNPLWQMTQ